jgi:chloramphenicol-sensitive protein RarD
MKPDQTARGTDPALTGAFCALGAFLLWGIAPVYFKILIQVPAPEILAHRILWSVVLMAFLVLALRRTSALVTEITSWRRLGVYAATTVLISGNWLLFIWAVNAGFLVESSLGYYINPLVNVLLGVLFLGERLNGRQGIAVALAMVGVGSMVVGVGHVPWISLVLAFSFGFYALLRKMARVDPVAGLLVETALVAPFALGWLIWLGDEGAWGSVGWGLDLLLVGLGAVTAVPLILFNMGAQRLRLSTIGIMQYIAPTMQLGLGTLVYGEAFTMAHAIAFGFIWAALLVFSSNAFQAHRAARQAAAE